MQSTIICSRQQDHSLPALVCAPALATSLLATTACVHAHTFCVTNGNATQLQDAMTHSSDKALDVVKQTGCNKVARADDAPPTA